MEVEINEYKRKNVRKRSYCNSYEANKSRCSTSIPNNSIYRDKCVADGSVDTEFIPVESEHSAMSAAMGSQAAGARTMTATSSCGLALMWEMLYVVASARLPVTLACVNRALTGPININADHSDSMGARDADGFNYIVKLTKKLMTICYKLIELENTQMYNFQ